ncbi:MAG: A/G-specific adenine glycosylase [Candidatus Omnitrophica bacterium]|nr:A/G-specific adenine glycosylase [Candidatus Omnitrophota bacterium]
MNKVAFQKIVYDYFHLYGRDLPWRKAKNPYHVVVSEIMLQQTQVRRVLQKYPLFVRRFPTIESLARASLKSILKVWQGMGYNRRALLLKRFAQRIVSEYKGKIPSCQEVLETLPGIGKATAASICAFAFNQPVVFLETNIRSVYIYHYFRGKDQVRDQELLPFVAETLDYKNPRKWYNALMDYGVFLKQKSDNPGRCSLHYRRQSQFEGSSRQIRGRILTLLLKTPGKTGRQISATLGVPAEKAQVILTALLKEGLVRNSAQGDYSI